MFISRTGKYGVSATAKRPDSRALVLETKHKANYTRRRDSGQTESWKALECCQNGGFAKVRTDPTVRDTTHHLWIPISPARFSGATPCARAIGRIAELSLRRMAVSNDSKRKLCQAA